MTVLENVDLDENEIENLKIILGDRFKNIISEFLTLSDSVMKKIERDISLKNSSAIVTSSRTLSASARQLGARKFETFMTEITKYALENDYNKCSLLFIESRNALKILNNKFTRIISS